MSKTVVIGVAFVVAVVAYLAYSSMHIAKYRVEVCVVFHGANQCRTASADTQEHALRSAQSNACALLVSGVTDTMQCERQAPTSIRWLDRTR
jgi:2-C-methyl-D-erythritol 4-phosphate cytidylyltransferase